MQHVELSSDIYLPFLTAPACHCASCAPSTNANYNSYRRSLPIPPPSIPPQPLPVRLSLAPHNYTAPTFQTMPIRTQLHSTANGSQLHDHIDANRLSLFSSFGKEAPEVVQSLLGFNGNYTATLVADTGDRKRAANGRRQIQPMDQRRSPYYYNDVLADPLPDAHLPEPIITNAIIECDRTNDQLDRDASTITLNNDERNDDDELQRNTLFNANLMSNSISSLDI